MDGGTVVKSQEICLLSLFKYLSQLPFLPPPTSSSRSIFLIVLAVDLDWVELDSGLLKRPSWHHEHQFFELESLRMEWQSLHLNQHPWQSWEPPSWNPWSSPLPRFFAGFFAAYAHWAAFFIPKQISMHFCESASPVSARKAGRQWWRNETQSHTTESQITLAVIQPAGFDIILKPERAFLQWNYMEKCTLKTDKSESVILVEDSRRQLIEPHCHCWRAFRNLHGSGGQVEN